MVAGEQQSQILRVNKTKWSFQIGFFFDVFVLTCLLWLVRIYSDIRKVKGGYRGELRVCLKVKVEIHLFIGGNRNAR